MSQQSQNIALELIDVADRLREVDFEQVNRMAVSMKERGLISAVKLRPQNAGRYRLVAGAHRFAAAQLLGWPEIRADIDAMSEDEARLWEIDENLHRSELTPFDQANFIEERRQIWVRLHGGAKRGGDRRSKVQLEPLIDKLSDKKNLSAFLDETAASLGVHRSTVKRALFRRGHIMPKLWSALKGTDAAMGGAALLDKLRKLPVDQQEEVLAFLQERGCAVVEAVRLTTRPEQKDAEEIQFGALKLAWNKASEDARERFDIWRRKQK